MWFTGYTITMKIALNIISWFKTISEDEVSTLKRLKMLFLKQNVSNGSQMIYLEEWRSYSWNRL